MAWVEVCIIEDTLTEDKDGRAKAKVVLYAEADDAFVESDAALAADDGTQAVPARRESYSAGRPRCRVIEREVTRVNKACPNQFVITVSYEDPTDGSDTATLLSLPADIKQSYEQLLEPYTLDAEGTPCTNTAGQPFDQFPERPSKVKVYQIKKYVTATGKSNIEAAANTNNASAKSIDGTSHPTDTLVLCDPTFDEVEDEDGVGTGVYEANYTIKHNPNKWIDEPLNVGYQELVGGDVEDILGGDNKPVQRPWPLETDGSAKATNTPSDFDTLTLYPFPQHAWTGVPLS
jgi:hypothetical protein